MAWVHVAPHTRKGKRVKGYRYWSARSRGKGPQIVGHGTRTYMGGRKKARYPLRTKLDRGGKLNRGEQRKAAKDFRVGSGWRIDASGRLVKKRTRRRRKR